MEQSELVAEALGEHIFEWFLRNKRREWQGYKSQVTPFEIDRYLRSAVMRSNRGDALDSYASSPATAAARWSRRR